MKKKNSSSPSGEYSDGQDIYRYRDRAIKVCIDTYT